VLRVFALSVCDVCRCGTRARSGAYAVKLDTYYRQILVPANVAISAIRRAGLPIDVERTRELRATWTKELEIEKRFVEGEAAKRGVVLKYSDDKHGIAAKKLSDFLFKKPGLGLDFPEQMKSWEMRQMLMEGQKYDFSTGAEVLAWFASLSVPKPDDNPVVRSVLRVRSLAGSISKYMDKFERMQRADGAVHASFNWALRTSRISASNPPIHGITERSDAYVAAGIKSCIVPRVAPYRVREWDPKKGNFGGWDPRKHGWCGRWDISGAEAAIRAGVLTFRYCEQPEPIAWEYIRLGKDIHGKTASLIYNVPDGTYAKGSYERDAVGKQTFFAKIFGANWRTVQGTIWKKARLWLPDDQAQKTDTNFDKGYPGLVELYNYDKITLGQRAADSPNNVGWCVDAYGRRRSIPLPEGVSFDEAYAGAWGADPKFPGYSFDTGNERTEKEMKRQLNHAFHVMANTPTQSMNATDNFWMLALAYHGEGLVEEMGGLQVPSMWAAEGVQFPEAAGWQMHEGAGPGGRPLMAWHNNTVHDSGWFDGAPGHIEPTMMLLWRRCHALPLDWRLEADVPYRIDLSVGPDMANLCDYNLVAKEFGLTPMPKR